MTTRYIVKAKDNPGKGLKLTAESPAEAKRRANRRPGFKAGKVFALDCTGAYRRVG